MCARLNVEIINTGSELLIGNRVNSHAQWLGRRFTELGYKVERQVSVPDNGPSIQAAVKEAMGRADIIVTTGGLGPTSDDLTRDLVAELFGRTLSEDAAIVEHIRVYFAARNKVMPGRTRVQARVPAGALVLRNACGTAPGLVLEASPNPWRPCGTSSRLIMLPGPPRELQPMFENEVVPYLGRQAPPETATASRVIRSTGVGESWIEDLVEEPLRPLIASGLEFSICGHPGEVEVRVTARGCGAEETADEAGRIIHRALGGAVYGGQSDTLEGVVVRMLSQHHWTLAVAESCTGGLIANRLTNVPGASEVFTAGWVTYSNEAKTRCLDVSREDLDRHGAVSEIVARQMAEGALAAAHSDFAIAVTGIAGPTGGTALKPAGTVFIALAGRGGAEVIQCLNPYDRETFKRVTSQQALNILRQRMLSLSGVSS